MEVKELQFIKASYIVFSFDGKTHGIVVLFVVFFEMRFLRENNIKLAFNKHVFYSINMFVFSWFFPCFLSCFAAFF